MPRGRRPFRPPLADAPTVAELQADPYFVLTRQVVEARTPAERAAAMEALRRWCERRDAKR